MMHNFILGLFALIMENNTQQNGVAERMNKTILNMVRSMLFFKKVKIMFWADVVLCAAYIKNRCPSNAIRNKTPYEMWYGHVPSVKHLRVFGSTCYALIPCHVEQLDFVIVRRYGIEYNIMNFM